MTTLYRSNRPKNFPICETFDKEAIQSLIDNPACAFFRIYYGMKPDLSVDAVLVAADANGNDLLPSGNFSDALQKEGGDGNEILEDAMRCPDNCPPASPLNGG